jgi:hypothetical protein
MSRKRKRLNRWLWAFEQGAVRIPNDGALIAELQVFEATQLQSGMMRYSAPAGGHDDMVVSLMLEYSAVSGASRMSSRGIFDLYQR